MNIRPKSFGPVFAHFDGTDTLQYAYKDAADRTPHAPIGTPVDTLLASLGACMVKSLLWAAREEDVALGPFSVDVRGIKALDAPNRIETMEIGITGGLTDDRATAQRLVTQAKTLCTVSNSLNCTVNVALHD